MTGNRITLVTLGVSDPGRSRQFYEAWGWAVETAMEDVVFFDMDGSKFGLYRLSMLAEELGRGSPELGMGASTLARNEISEEAVEASITRAVEAGATLIRPARRMHWGGYSGYIADPDGHVWEIAHNPFWPLDSRGRIAPGKV